MLGPTYAPTLAIAWRRARILLARHLVQAFILAVLFASPWPLTVSAQDTEDDVIRVNTDLLLFPIRIKDKKSQTVTDFSEKDLSLKDPDGVTSGLYFSAGVDRVALVFALDQSGSLREIVAQQRTAAVALFSRFSDRSSIAVIRFSETSELAAPFNTDPAAAKAAFELPAARDRHTAIFDAAAKSISTFDTLPRVRGERRIVILISDGLDNVSRAKPNDIIRLAVENNVSFYVIHLPLFEPRDGRLSVRTPTKGFRDLAEKTGGSYFLVGDPKTALSPAKTQDLTPIFNAIEEDLRSQYLVGFYIAQGARRGGTHRVSINVTRPGVTYSLGRFGYAKSHNFVVTLTPRKGN
jgi:VWFA-related protein